MQTASLALLEESQLPPAQARAILRVMESEIALRDTALATKADLRDGLHGLELKLEVLRGELKSESGNLKSEIKGTIRWNFAFWVAQLAAIAGILKLLK